MLFLQPNSSSPIQNLIIIGIEILYSARKVRAISSDRMRRRKFANFLALYRDESSAHFCSNLMRKIGISTTMQFKCGRFDNDNL